MQSETEVRATIRSDKEHIEIRPSVLYVGTPVVLITSLNPDGTTNISPMSSVWALTDRVVLGMSSTSKGGENAVRAPFASHQPDMSHSERHSAKASWGCNKIWA